MILKDYQQAALDDLENFLQILDAEKSLPTAYKIFWENRDVPAKPPYQNNIAGVPQVCFKVPTGGGKTFMAAASLKIICDHINSKIIVWLVPSETILSQTYKNLSDASHAYNKKICADFNCKVEIYTKEQLLAGENFSPSEIANQLSILVLSYDSFRKKSKEFYKVFQENERLENFSAEFAENENFLSDAEKNSLIQVIRHYKPIVIVDESHHAKTNLSVEMLKNFSPSFILELTATPKENSNVITYVPAWKLKSAGMVKLPVIVYNRHTQKEVISDAISFRERLEKISSAEQIRPIVLFQAESKGKGDRITFEKIKSELIENFKIPAEQIAIKTAEINDLKNIDLMAENCPIKFIITINALKEGWDCPFAYILASLANRNSAVDVEQILGRILRRPFTKNFSDRKLNMSYVFTASADFRQTLEKIIVGLNSAGFSENEYRAVNEVEENFVEKISVEPLQLENEKIPVDEIKKSPEKNSVEEKFQQADELGEEYEKNFANISDKVRSVEEQNKMTEFFMREKFRGEKVILPQFFYRGESNLFETNPDVKISKEMLCKNFSLKDKDTEIDFDNLNYEIASFDLYDDENIPQYQLLNERDAKIFMDYFKNLPTKSQVRQCVDIISQKIDRKKNLPSSTEIKNYVRRIVCNILRLIKIALKIKLRSWSPNTRKKFL